MKIASALIAVLLIAGAGLAGGSMAALRPLFAIAVPYAAVAIFVAGGFTVSAIGGIERYIEKGDVVVIKPNVAFERPAALGATTNPEVLVALIELVREAGAAEIRVADNPIESPQSCFVRTGIQAAAVKAGARVYLPSAGDFETLNVPGATWIEKWPFFWRPFQGAHKVIGVAPVKDHNLCRASMTTKNWYGLLGGRRNQFHQDIHGIIADLALMLRPRTVWTHLRGNWWRGVVGGAIASVGYGERPTQSPAVQLITIAVILLGFTAAAYTFGGLLQLLLAGELEQYLGRRRMERDISKLSGHAIVVGFGRIGRAVASKAAAFGMRVAYSSRTVSSSPLGESMPFDRLLSTSDVVTLHCPLTPDTRHLIGRRGEEAGIDEEAVVAGHPGKGAHLVVREARGPDRRRRRRTAALAVAAVPEAKPAATPTAPMARCRTLSAVLTGTSVAITPPSPTAKPHTATRM